MAVTVEQIVETQMRIIDKMTGPLEKIASALDKTNTGVKTTERSAQRGVGGLSSMFSGLEGVFQSLLPLASTVGAALGFKSVLDTTTEYIRRVKSIHDLTGATAEQTDFLLSSARKAGIEYSAMEQIMFSLSRRGAAMQQQMATFSGKTLPSSVQRMAQLGVSIAKGPIVAIQQMAKGVQAGRIGAEQLMQEFRIPPGSVNDFKSFLEDLDEAALKKASMEKGRFVNAADLSAFSKMEGAQHRIADAWNRIQVLVGRRLLPVIAELVDKVAGRLEREWLPAAQRFGEFLADNMDRIVIAAKTFVTVMTARKMMSLVSGLAGEGWLGKLAKGGLGGLVGGGGAALGGFGASLGGIASMLVAAAPALLAIGAAVGVIWLGFKAIQQNVDGVKDRLMRLWDSIRARFELLGAAVMGLWDMVAGIFGEKSSFTAFIGKVAALGFEKLVQGVDVFVHVLQTSISFLGELGDQMLMVWRDYLAKPWKEWVVNPFLESMKWLGQGVQKLFNLFIRGYNTVAERLGMTKIGTSIKSFDFDLGLLQEPVDMWRKHWLKTESETEARAARIRGDRLVDETKARAAADRGAPDKRPAAPYYDFRGSRFDVTQNFAEGFDPDRIAVAFANDLASLGELRAQSGFAPLFGTR